MEDVEYQINNIKQNLAGQMPKSNSNMINNNQMNNMNYMNNNMPINNMMNMPINNMMNMPINNMNMMNNTGVTTFNTINPYINNSSNNYKPNSSPINDLLPRNTRTSIYDDNSVGYKISITFTASSGKKVIMKMDESTTVEKMLKEYAKVIDLPEDTFGKEVRFLYNGDQLDFKSQEIIGKLFRNTSVITVYDLEGIIGLCLWTINFDTSTGLKISMKINQNKTIKDMMDAFANEIRVPKESIGKDIIFLYNGRKLDENDSVKRVLRDKTTVTVFDANNVIGMN